MTNYTEDERQAIVERAHDLIEQGQIERAELAAKEAERQARLEAGDLTEILREADEFLARSWRPPEPPSPPVVKSVPRGSERRREIPAWISLHIRQEVAAAVRRELRSEAKGGLADSLGGVLARERAQFRTITDALISRIAALELEARAAPDNGVATVLDLSDERRRRAGE